QHPREGVVMAPHTLYIKDARWGILFLLSGRCVKAFQRSAHSTKKRQRICRPKFSEFSLMV
ncbi:MAG: hypothetical protein IKK27_00530, partial [Alistipes sp.]|nr:hypothetical protein [Alistipes sp.]